MTENKPNAAGERTATFKNAADKKRWYRDPLNPTKTYPGVTSVLSVLPKPGIVKARENALIEYAAHNREVLAGFTKGQVKAILKDQDEYLPAWSVGAPFGTAVHTVIENLIEGRAPEFGVLEVEGNGVYPVSNTFAEWVPPLWQEFLTKYNVKILHVEGSVVSDAHRYAGSFDLIVEMDDPDNPGVRIIAIVDVKTNKNGPQASTALQNMFYAKADCIMDFSTGERSPMPKITHSFIFWLHENPEMTGRPSWALVPLRFDEVVWKWAYGALMVYAWTLNEFECMGSPVNGPEPYKRFIPWHLKDRA